jgi:hypothetical protein
MLILLVWMVSSIEPGFHHRDAIRVITLTRAPYTVWYHHRLSSRTRRRARAIDLENPFFFIESIRNGRFTY